MLVSTCLIAAIAIGYATVKNLSFWWLTIAVILSIIAMLRPMAGLLMFIILDVYLTSYYLGPMPIRYYSLILLLAVLGADVTVRRRTLDWDRRARSMLLVTVVYMAWVFLREMEYREVDDVAKWILGRIAVGPILALCIAYFAVTKHRLSVLVYALMGTISLSAFVAIMQFFNVPSFLGLRTLVVQFISESETHQRLLATQPGAPGLAPYTVTLAYQAAFIAPVTLSLFWGVSRRWQRLLLATCTFVLFLGLIATVVISGILGTLVAFGVVTWLWSEGRMLWRTFGFIVLLVLLTNLIAPGMLVRQTIADSNTWARIPAFLLATMVTLRNPLGVGIGRYSASIDPFLSEIANLPGLEIALGTAPHNTFLNVLAFFGIPAFTLYLIFYVHLGRSVLRLLQCGEATGDPLVKAFVIGLAGAFTANLLNSLVHNAGLFYGDQITWYGIGMLWGLLNRTPMAVHRLQELNYRGEKSVHSRS